MKRTKQSAQQSPTRARGYALIPADRLDLVTKVVKRLKKEGISFLMEDVDAGVIRQLHCVEGVHEIRLTDAIRITWPDPEGCDASA